MSADYGESTRVVKRELKGAVRPHRHATYSAKGLVRDSAILRLDVRDQILTYIAAETGPAVGVIQPVTALPCGRDDYHWRDLVAADHLTGRVEQAHVAPVVLGSTETVEHVEHRHRPDAAVIAGRQVDEKGHVAA